MTPDRQMPDTRGHFGPFGGRYVPETLMAPLEDLERAYETARQDPAFQAELDDLLANYAGRPTPLYEAKRLSPKGIDLQVNKDNARALRLYDRCGFKIAGEDVNAYSGAPVYLMRWRP